MPVSRPRGLPIGWPLLAVIGGYPVAWLLGVKLFVWPLAALLLMLWLLKNRQSLRAPAGIGLWFLFLAWTVVSAVMLAEPGRLASWGYRESLYITATVILLFLANVSSREVATRRIAIAVLTLFTASIGLGMLGILFPDYSIPTLAEKVLPPAILQNPFMGDQVQARLGGEAEFIEAVRPAAPYGYTNEWGAAMGVLMPLSVYCVHLLRTARARKIMWAIIAFSIVPIVISVNRGLWASVIMALLVVFIRAGLARRFALLGSVGAAMVVGGLLVFLTPLHGIITNRLDRANLGTRETLVGSAIKLTKESPLFGYGAPVDVSGSVADTNSVSVGTHGQIWTLLVSHGVPGAVFYVAFFAVVLVLTWSVQGWGLWAWTAIMVSLIQLPFYNAVPVPLVLAMIAVAICWRELAAREQATRPPPSLDLSVPAAGVPGSSLAYERNTLQ